MLEAVTPRAPWPSRLFRRRKPREVAAQTLAPFAIQRTRSESRRRTAVLVTAIALVGAIYGFLISVLPMAFWLYMVVPIAVLVLFVIWALPASDHYSSGAIEWLFFAVFCATFLWPNYLAVALPGLPWITMIRLFALPMTLLTLTSLSASRDFRHRIWEPFTTSPWMPRLMIVFIITQIITLPLSNHIGDSVNRLMNAQFQWTAAFFLATYVFSKPGRAEWWIKLLCVICVFLCVAALQEWYQEKVLWAGHVPAFLAVDDPVVQSILSGARRDDIYRLQSIFTTSLNFAEFVGLVMPFFIYLFLNRNSLLLRFLIILYLPYSFWIIRETDSRLGVVAFFSTLLLYFLLWAIKNWMKRKNDVFAPLWVLVYPALATAFFILTLVWQRLGNMVWGGGEQAASTEGRKEQWAEGMPKILKQPFGNGIGEGATTLGHTNPAGTLTIDSYYLLVALEYGVIGFLAYYGLMLVGVWQGVKYGLRSKSREAEILLAAAVMLTVFIIVKGVLAQEDSHGLVFMVLGLVAALAHKVSKETPEERAGGK